MVSRQPNSLVLTFALALLGIGAALLQVLGIPLVGLVAIPLVLFLPGYALTRVIFKQSSLGAVERLVISVGASIALTVLGGLVLNLTPWGLQHATWLFLLSGITLLLTAWAWLSERRSLVIAPTRPPLALPAADILLASCAIIAVAVALVLSQMPVSADRVQGYTSLWLMPPAATNAPLTFGITSQETGPVTYRLELYANEKLLQSWNQVHLQPGANWDNSFAASSVKGEIVQARLYRLDQPNTLYRTVHLQVP